MLRQSKKVSAMARKPRLCHLIRDTRIERGFTVAEVAKRVGVSVPCVYFWETDQTRPREKNLSALCKVLRLPLREAMEMAAA
jgi:transcriptional regulator with XRE-family HTH domain